MTPMTPMGDTTFHTTFATKLRTVLDSRSMGIRTLARAVVDLEPQVDERDKRIDNVRRQLREYLKGAVMPTERTRRTIERALKLDQDTLKGDDDEEDDPVAKPATIRVHLDLPLDLLAEAVAARNEVAATAKLAGSDAELARERI